MNTVVVIGSGPGSSRLTGKDIDRHTVVRMWNHDWQPVDRYGSRYDYGLITNIGDAHDAKRRPNKAWLFYNVPHQEPVSNINGHKTFVLNHAKWYEMAALHGAAPASSNRALKFTRGFAAVAGAIEYLRPREVIVIGMSILRDGETGRRYYDKAALPFYVKAYPRLASSHPEWAADQMPQGLRGEGPHDYFAESLVIRDLAEEFGTEIIWE